MTHTHPDMHMNHHQMCMPRLPASQLWRSHDANCLTDSALGGKGLPSVQPALLQRKIDQLPECDCMTRSSNDCHHDAGADLVPLTASCGEASPFCHLHPAMGQAGSGSGSEYAICSKPVVKQAEAEASVVRRLRQA